MAGNNAIVSNPCTCCGLHRFRRNVVMGRGVAPAPILYIGEAPGKVEDIRGEAFVGPAGKLLSSLISDAIKLAGLTSAPPCYITNTVGCRPCDKLGGENREPTSDEVLACLPRFEYVLEKVKPVIVVFLGKVAAKYFEKRFPEHFKLYHPSYLLRGGGIAHPEYALTVRKLSEVYTYYHKEVECLS